MEHIIYIAISAVICGAQSWNEIEAFGHSKIDFFKKRLPDLVSIPSHDTFNWFFSILDSQHFELIFRNWAKQICDKIEGVVVIDGKLMRGSSKCNAEPAWLLIMELISWQICLRGDLSA
ncbi:MAG: ISAs1 family transposase [Bacteroides sp.]|nr:ISAs1 family transposase [Bacteroides sp.]